MEIEPYPKNSLFVGNSRGGRTAAILASLTSTCRRRQVDAVVVYRYDRFARSLRQLVNARLRIWLARNPVCQAYMRALIPPRGRLVFGIFASIAEFERELTREQVRSGFAVARAQGKRIGRPRVPVDARRVGELHAERAVLGRDGTGNGARPRQRAPGGTPHGSRIRFLI
jgi:DNA invertase Pin-like site-specific DNA recombinase